MKNTAQPIVGFMWALGFPQRDIHNSSAGSLVQDQVTISVPDESLPAIPECLDSLQGDSRAFVPGKWPTEAEHLPRWGAFPLNDGTHR